MTLFQEPFALLDDAGASDAVPTSRLYTGFVREHRCTDPAELDATWAAVQADLRGPAPLHAVLLADYEWGARLIGNAHHPAPADEPAALRLLMFRRMARLSADAVSAWLAAQDDGAPAGTLGLTPSVDDAAFDAAIAAIHAAIADGETYQVNYTYRLDGQAWGEPLALYRRLRERQPVPYGALIALPARSDDARRWVLSRSPELFLRHEAGLVTARPMKGTARRVAGDPLGDSETARELAGDTKNRAENLMIVDLLRNDLGRIAQIGSVRVPQLFDIEPYTTVFQMTSTVQARLQPAVDFAALLRATFPCGSITGAPKRRTMQWIERLESTPRGLYCGAIGWVDAAADPGQRCEDFCLNVAIRTLTLGEARNGLRPLRLGVGAGIVMDSVAADERAECRLKARFLTALDPGFELFETMRGEPHYGIALMDEHLARLSRSAQALGFAFDAHRRPRPAGRGRTDADRPDPAAPGAGARRPAQPATGSADAPAGRARRGTQRAGAAGAVTATPAGCRAAGGLQDHAAGALRRRRGGRRGAGRLRQPVLHPRRPAGGGRAQQRLPAPGWPLVDPAGERWRPARRDARPAAGRPAGGRG
jgi:para-aminobenzoate synthetase/4-amino-4-deoxychorismate lyase